MTAHSQLAEPPSPATPPRSGSPRPREDARTPPAAIEERRRQRRTRMPPRQRSLARPPHAQAQGGAGAVRGRDRASSGAAMGTIPTRVGGGLVDRRSTRRWCAFPRASCGISQSLKEALVQEEGVRDVVYLRLRRLRDRRAAATWSRPPTASSSATGSATTVSSTFSTTTSPKPQQAVSRIAGDMPLYQHEYDALVDLVYNVGPGALTVRQEPAADGGDGRARLRRRWRCELAVPLRRRPDGARAGVPQRRGARECSSTRPTTTRARPRAPALARL